MGIGSYSPNRDSFHRLHNQPTTQSLDSRIYTTVSGKTPTVLPNRSKNLTLQLSFKKKNPGSRALADIQLDIAPNEQPQKTWLVVIVLGECEAVLRRIVLDLDLLEERESLLPLIIRDARIQRQRDLVDVGSALGSRWNRVRRPHRRSW
jgi:hypothetical protein